MRSAFLRALTLLILTLGLAACASGPRYQSTYRYEPPTDAAGRACLEECEHQMTACRDQCATKTQACLKDLEPLVDERYNAAMNRYGIALDCYRQELVQYELYLSMSWGYPSPWWHPGMWPYASFAMPYYFPPSPPAKSKPQCCVRTAASWSAAMWIAAASRFMMPVSLPVAARKFPRQDASAIVPLDGVTRFGFSTFSFACQCNHFRRRSV